MAGWSEYTEAKYVLTSVYDDVIGQTFKPLIYDSPVRAYTGDECF